MAKEIYQIQPVQDFDSLVEQLNLVLFEISKRLADLDIPNEDIEDASTVADLVTALISAGIGKES
jgi:hypothetical protein